MNFSPLRRFVLAAIGLASLFHVSAESPGPDSGRMPIGMNLASPTDWNPGFPFKNLMWGARAWSTRNADGSGPLTTNLEAKMSYNKQGYPTEIPFRPEGAEAEQMVFTVIPNSTEPGRYVLLYEGDGEIVPALTTKFVSSEPGRIEIELKNTGSDNALEGFGIKRSAKENPIRNIRILRLEDENADLAANPFRDDFLKYVKQWHAIRYMDWTATNNSLEEEWADRKPVDFYTMIGHGGDAIGRWGAPANEYRRMYSGGVALEIIIQLANMTKTDVWISVPHLATEEYITEMAKMFKEKLDPSRKIYVEYSNEVWNWQFFQALYMLNSKLAAEGLDPALAWKDGVVPTEFPYHDGTVAKDGGAGHPERMGVLARRVFKIFEDVFSGDDRKRIVRVLGTQQGWPEVSRRMVAWVMKNGGADALSPASYINPDKESYAMWDAAGASLTGAEVLADAERLFEKTRKHAIEQAQIAKDNNLRLVIYEGGQHLQPEGQKEKDYMPGLKEAQFLPGMYVLTKKNIDLQRELGADLFCAFNSTSKQGTRFGSWGHSESFDPPLDEAPKLRALIDSNLSR